MKKIGLFTGTFDPLTQGHMDIIKRASILFDDLYIGIFQNDRKNPLFTSEQRKLMISQEVDHLDNVHVIVQDEGLTVNVAKKLHVTCLIRSIRNAEDLAYESDMIYFNNRLGDLETVLFLAKPELQYISSSRVKEIFKLGGDISPYVSENILNEMEKLVDRR